MSECLDFLVNPKDANTRLLNLTIELAAYMLQLSGLEKDLDAARKKSEEALYSGKAASIFGKMIFELGGPIDLLETPFKHLPPMPVISSVKSQSSGYISKIDVRAVGLSMIHLKAGRTKSTDPIDHGVGLSEIVSVGQWVNKGEPLAMAHCRDNDQLSYLEKTLPSLINLSEDQTKNPVLIHEVLSSTVDSSHE